MLDPGKLQIVDEWTMSGVATGGLHTAPTPTCASEALASPSIAKPFWSFGPTAQLCISYLHMDASPPLYYYPAKGYSPLVIPDLSKTDLITALRNTCFLLPYR